MRIASLVAEFHDFHHLKFNVNYGVLGFLDWFHATDGMMYDTKFAHIGERDRVFYSFDDKKEMPKQRGMPKALSRAVTK